MIAERCKLFLLCVLVLPAACASTPRVRNLASQTGVVVQTLNVSTNHFLEVQSDLNKNNATRLDVMAAEAERQRQSVSQQQFAWVDSGDQVRIATFARATAVSSADIVGSLAVKAPVATSVTSDVSGSYDAATKALAAIAAKPKPLDEIEELFAFAQGVNDTYAKLQDAAAESAAGTETKAKAQDAATTSSGTAATASSATP